MISSVPASAPTTYIRDESGAFVCPHCDKKCDKQNTMYYHIKKNHQQDFKFVCEHCPDGKFVQKSAYLQHIATNHPECADEEANPYASVSFSCPHEGCDHSAKTKANIVVHFARSHCKDWIPAYSKKDCCKGCEKEFASSTAYLYHAVGCIKPVPEHYAAMLAEIRPSGEKTTA
jgi:hypothetical protein